MNKSPRYKFLYLLLSFHSNFMEVIFETFISFGVVTYSVTIPSASASFAFFSVTLFVGGGGGGNDVACE